MITRAQMPRQLRNRGGMTVKTVRQKYGLGSLVKKTIRKLIPNELADIAVKAAPFVAPFNPGAAALMRGVGRFDQRGSISDALKQGAATYGFGQAARFAGGAGFQKNFLGTPGDRFTTPFGKETGLGKMFGSKETTSGNIADEFVLPEAKPTTPVTKEGTGIIRSITDATLGKVPLIEKLPKSVLDQLVVGGITSGASALYSYFSGDFRPQEEGETMEEYLAARKVSVGKQMRTFMDNYYRFDPEYSAMSDAEKDAFVARYNMKKGGIARVGFQDGGSFPLEGYGIGTYNADKTLIQTGYAPGGIASYNTPEEAAAMGIFPIRKEDQDLISLTGSGLLNQAAIGRSQQAVKNEAALDMLNQSMAPTTQTPTTQTPTTSTPSVVDISSAAATRPEDVDTTTLEEIMNQPLDPVPTNNPFENFLGADRSPAITGGRSLRENVAINEQRRRRNQELLDAAKSRLPIGIMPPSRNAGIRGGFAEPVTLDGQQFTNEADAIKALGIERYNQLMAKGGSVKKIPVRTNPEGIKELDYRKTGGFVPIGVKEKADDVPAMLSKNEFVFTADAVRGAGKGSIKKGAQRMYDTMKKLESRVG
jgi:hypothetical protein